MYIYSMATTKLVGSVEGLAEGETIHSVRFTGDRVYMVTFRNVDPLFVIDASDPVRPKVSSNSPIVSSCADIACLCRRFLGIAPYISTLLCTSTPYS